MSTGQRSEFRRRLAWTPVETHHHMSDECSRLGVEIMHAQLGRHDSYAHAVNCTYYNLLYVIGQLSPLHSVR